MTRPESARPALRVRVGFELRFEPAQPTPMLFVVEPQDAPDQRLVAARRALQPTPPQADFSTYRDTLGNVVWRLLAQPGPLTVAHDLLVEVSPDPDPQLPDLPGTPVEALPAHTLQFLLPSRYGDADLLAQEAWDRFGGVPWGWAQVQAISDHLHAHVSYGVGSTPSTTAQQAYAARIGVCRDFAHLGVAFCRALNIPARYVCGYLPDIGVAPDDRPMDFHAWFEAWVGGAWRTFDARHNRPRTGRVRIAVGRDAADVAFCTSFGSAPLHGMRVWADRAALTDLPSGWPGR